jgi:hypothetical protein
MTFGRGWKGGCMKNQENFLKINDLGAKSYSFLNVLVLTESKKLDFNVVCIRFIYLS